MKYVRNREEAETLAIEVLSYIAGDSQLLPRFLALSGITADEIRGASAVPGFFAGVLQFLLTHEPTLLAFCEVSDYAPQSIARAVALLPGGEILE